MSRRRPTARSRDLYMFFRSDSSSLVGFSLRATFDSLYCISYPNSWTLAIDIKGERYIRPTWLEGKLGVGQQMVHCPKGTGSFL